MSKLFKCEIWLCHATGSGRFGAPSAYFWFQPQLWWTVPGMLAGFTSCTTVCTTLFCLWVSPIALSLVQVQVQPRSIFASMFMHVIKL